MTSSFFARYESDFYEWSMQQAALVAEASVSVSLGPMAPWPHTMDSSFGTRRPKWIPAFAGMTSFQRDTLLSGWPSFPRKRESIT